MQDLKRRPHGERSSSQNENGKIDAHLLYDLILLKASRVRTLVARDFDAAFERCDVVVGPTSPTAAFPLGERTSDPLAMYLSDVFTVPPSLAGLPSMSVPAGTNGDDLPVGLQLTAPAFAEARLFSLGAAFERATGHAARRPPT